MTVVVDVIDVSSHPYSWEKAGVRTQVAGTYGVSKNPYTYTHPDGPAGLDFPHTHGGAESVCVCVTAFHGLTGVRV